VELDAQALTADQGRGMQDGCSRCGLSRWR
jgi:hypothetical protein